MITSPRPINNKIKLIMYYSKFNTTNLVLFRCKDTTEAQGLKVFGGEGKGAVML